MGVLFISLAGKGEPDIGDATLSNDTTMRAIGIVTMLFVALNDASINVLARTMKQLHFSLVQFWFSVIGLVLIVSFQIANCIVRSDWPTIFSNSGE